MATLHAAFTLTDRPEPYVMAEVGVNHDGSVEDAHALVDLAADGGADAVKFQTFDPAALVADDAATAEYQARQTAVRTQRELLDQYVLPRTAWSELQAHAVERGLEFLSTAFDLASLDLVCDLGVHALKIGSGELTNKPLLLEIARRNLPVICSTGMGTADEVGDAVDWLDEAPAVVLLHCISSYPTPVEQANLRAIVTLRDRFALPTGWSDHTVGSLSAVVAVALGAAVLEKHVTLDTARPGPDHAASADAAAFGEYVRQVRAAHAALGSGVKQPAPAETANIPLVRRSWHAARDLRPGERLAPSDLALLRPATGIAPAVDPTGREVRRPVARGAALTPDDLVEHDAAP